MNAGSIVVSWLMVAMCVVFTARYGAPAEASTAADAPGIRHVQVYHQEGRFAGWPGNHGIWSWGNEILVGFVEAVHVNAGPHSHSYDDSTARLKFARSNDGGVTWQIEDAFEQGITGEARNHRIGNQAQAPRQLDQPIDFTHPDFAMLFGRRNNGPGPSHFHYTHDRGRTWRGPYAFPNLDTHGVAARTDYIVESRHEMWAFLTAAKANRQEGRVFCARTVDGGVTWERVAWIGPEPRGFNIMPTTVRLTDRQLLTVLRHRDGGTWLVAYRSDDNGRTWEHISTPVDAHINSPASMLRLADGRVVMVYVDRRNRAGGGSAVCAKITTDAGRTWSDEIVLRDNDDANWDVGYPVVIQRPDGQLVVVYYWNHANREGNPPERFLAATLVDPSLLAVPTTD